LKAKKYFLSMLSFVFVLLFAVVLTACKPNDNGNSTGQNDDSTEVQTQYFSTWVLGRDDIFNYNGDYTVTTKSFTYTNKNILTSKDENIEAKQGNNFFCVKTSYKINEDTSSLEVGFRRTQAIKLVQDGETQRTKYYNEVENNEVGYHTKEGKYVRPDYVEECAYNSPSATVEDCYIDNGNTYEEFLQSVNTLYLEDANREFDKIKFTKNKDNSITLKLVDIGEFVDEDETTPGYEKTKYTFTYTYKVKEGKMISLTIDWDCNYQFSDSSKNYNSLIKKVTDIDYTFNNTNYDAISVETETTTNTYLGSYYFVIEGYVFTYNDYRAVRENYSLDDAINYISQSDGPFSRNEGEVLKEYFSIYTDPEMTQAFTQNTTKYEDLNLYVKFNLPADKALVMCVLSGTKEALDLCFIVNKNDTFKITDTYLAEAILSVDGTNIEDGANTDLVCTESRIYIIKISGN